MGLQAHLPTLLAAGFPGDLKVYWVCNWACKVILGVPRVPWSCHLHSGRGSGMLRSTSHLSGLGRAPSYRGQRLTPNG